ncbi:unnamed protein product, partial [Iphiclides podalirius]
MSGETNERLDKSPDPAEIIGNEGPLPPPLCRSIADDFDFPSRRDGGVITVLGAVYTEWDVGRKRVSSILQ